MENQGLFDSTIHLLERAMDLRVARHNTIASNIANIDTPNYKAFDFVLEEELAREMDEGTRLPMAATDEGHLQPERPDSVVLGQAMEQSNLIKGDGNTVDLDKSMGNLAENQMMYNVTAQLVTKKMTGLKEVIQGGGS